LSTLTKHLTI